MSTSSESCKPCKLSFTEPAKLRLHNYRLHSTEVIVLVNGVPTKVLRNKDGFFHCPTCSRLKYTSPDSLKRHLKKHAQDKEAATKQNNNENKGTKSSKSRRIVVNDTPKVTSNNEIATPLSIAVQESTCDYKTAVLSAFDALTQPSKDQEKKLLIAELGDLKPIAFIDHEGKEYNLLAASKVIDNLILSQKKEERPMFAAINPRKRKHS